MVKPNWDIFNSKFSENKRDNFEWFCYVLFCKEYNKPFGIFRYKNQSAIETEPLEIGTEVIGFQSKFYDGTISSNHKDELIDTIANAKRDYPNITKIIFYINSEFGQGVGTREPKALSNTNEKASELNIEIEWRLKSYFESPFVTIEQAIISSHFFENSSIIDTVFQKQQQIKSILNIIHSDILFNNERIEINRENELNTITKNLEKNQLLLIHGNAGVGKTALIKKLYENKKDIPFYIFNARDLNITNINELASNYSFYDFININKDDKEKIIVIDSAEKLLDIIDNTPIIEFLSAIVKSNWKIIFTTRNNYLEDLQGVLLDTFRVPFYPINLDEITNEQLLLISKEKDFLLPDNEKVLDLIKKPFYLNEYLKCYKAEEIFNLKQFKEALWNNVIVKRDINRGKAFLELSNNRALTGQFYIVETNFKNSVKDLIKDGIIGNESKGYFIAHDIYEEWALEKFIDIHFEKREGTISFFNSIGYNLPIRRSFRNWISDKLFLNQEDIKTFIEDCIENEELDTFWKDEILIAVLLSKYSDAFFEYFENELLNDSNFNLLKRISFLLRLACKKADKSFFENIGLKKQLPSIFNNIFLEPKGYGWSSYIKFIFNNLDRIDYKKMNFVLPIIFEWNNKYKKGETTKFASLIALNYYNNLLNEGYYEKEPSNLIKTILFGASEIKNELEKIFKEVVENKYVKYNDPYYELCKPILTKMEYNHIAKISTKYVLKLADLFWYKPQRKKRNYRYDELEEEEYSLVDEHEFRYFPSSLFQTPIFWCLEVEQNLTFDFILDFTNKTIKSFLDTKRNSRDIYKVNFSINNIKIEQLHNSTLWGMYRGMNTSPYLLQSILIALEVYLLSKAKVLDKKNLETLLSYLLIKAENSAITAVIASIVLAYPEKTFDIALELFKVKEFIESDFNRAITEHTNNIDMSFDFTSQMHSLERETESKREHRKESLSNSMFKYQLLDKKYKKEKILIEEIIDNYYNEIDKKPKENKDWKLFISNHIDLRNMNVKEEVNKENQIVMSFEPKLNEELSNYKKTVLESINEANKYTQLSLWSTLKLDNNEKHKEYDIYSSNIPLVIKRIKEILESNDIFNERIPIDCSCILLRDFNKYLNKEEKILCKEILIDHIFHRDADYNIEKYISVFPTLIKQFSKEKDDLKMKLLKLLRLGYGIPTFISMWETDSKDVYSLVIAFLVLEPLYNIRYDEYRHREDRSGYRERLDYSKIWDEILEENKEIVKKFYNNELSFEDIPIFKSINIEVLSKVFNIFPMKIETDEVRDLSYKLNNTISNKILLDKEDKVSYQNRDSFCLNLSYIMLNSKFDEIDLYLKPIFDNFRSCEVISSLLDTLINTQKVLNKYECFWYIWEKLREPIVFLCKKGDGYGYIDKIIQSYFFSGYTFGRNIFPDNVKEWHTLKNKNRKFFKEVSESLGHCVTTLDSLSTILNGVASNYFNDGVFWISNILKHNNFTNKKLGVNTVYNLEILMRKYIYENRIKIVQTKNIKDSLLIILDFLIEKGSSRSYILRERIL